MSDPFATLNTMAKKARQLALHLPTWGGRRKHAGRKAKGKRPRVSHRPRELLRAGWAVHVTLRVHDYVWNLRSRRCFSVIERAFAAAKDRFGMRVVHFSVQGNHIHLLIEAADNEALARGMRGVTIRVAKALNRVMERRGPVLPTTITPASCVRRRKPRARSITCFGITRTMQNNGVRRWAKTRWIRSAPLNAMVRSRVPSASHKPGC